MAALALALLLPRPGLGQERWSRLTVDAGAAALRQHGQDALVAPTLAADARMSPGRAAVRATLSATLAAADRWSAQGELAGSRFLGPASSPWELGASASALRFNGVPAATTGAVLARRYVDRVGWGRWAGIGAGALARPRWHAPIAGLDAGAWLRRERLEGSVSIVVQRARLDSSASLSPEQDRSGPAIRPLTATDATLRVDWRSAPLELSGSATVRHAPAQASRPLAGALVSAAWRFAPGVALAATAGALAADPLRATPAMRLATLGVRWLPREVRRLSHRSTDAGAPVAADGRMAATVARRDGAQRLRIDGARGAALVEVRADFTGWHARPLVRGDGAWELADPLAAGTHRLVVRVDGGPWLPPANLPTVEDDFGERAGLLVVP